MQLLLPASIPQNPLERIWQRLNHQGTAVDVLSAAKVMCWCCLSFARYWCSAGSEDLGEADFWSHIVLRMNVWQEAWPERNCFLDRVIHSQTAVAGSESPLELRSSRGEGADDFGRGQF